MSNLTIRVSEELKAKFIQEAKRQNTTATALLSQWMEDYINGKKPSTDNRTNSTNSTAQASTDDALTARLKAIEEALWGNDKDIPEKAETAFNNYKGLEDSLKDLWNEHSQNAQDVRDLKRCFDGLSCSVADAHTDSTNSTNTALTNSNSPTSEEVGEANGEENPNPNQSEAIPAYANTATTDDKGIAPNDEEISTNSTNSTALTQKELAERLGVTTSAISRPKKKGNDSFREWSRGKDPEGVAWEYNSESEKFYPIQKSDNLT